MLVVVQRKCVEEMWWFYQANAGETWVDGCADCQARVDGPGLPEAQGLPGKAAGGCGGLVTDFNL